MVLRPEKGARGRSDLPQMGARFRDHRPDHRHAALRHQAPRCEVKADLPIKELGDEAPLYDRPWDSDSARAAVIPMLRSFTARCRPTAGAARKLLASPDLCSKRWVYEQYDSLILGNTVQGPGGDAAVMRLGDGPKGLALTTDVHRALLRGRPASKGASRRSRRRGAISIAVGARPLALTDNLNFGNPEKKPDAMGQLVGCDLRASARPRGRSTSRSSPAMSRSTTRRWAPASRQRRRSAAWASWRT